MDCGLWPVGVCIVRMWGVGCEGLDCEVFTVRVWIVWMWGYELWAVGVCILRVWIVECTAWDVHCGDVGCGCEVWALGCALWMCELRGFTLVVGTVGMCIVGCEPWECAL